jgi:hypothetical protein
MTSLHKSVANLPYGHVLSMIEYQQLLESSVYTQQAETESYDPLKVVTSKKAPPISDNLTFQVSPGSILGVNDFHNAYLCLEVERIFLYTKSAGGACKANIFHGDKPPCNFIKQFRICCNDITITENLDFVYETNILGATIADSVKLTKPGTFTSVGHLDSYERHGCRKYINLANLVPGSTVAL